MQLSIMSQVGDIATTVKCVYGTNKKSPDRVHRQRMHRKSRQTSISATLLVMLDQIISVTFNCEMNYDTTDDHFVVATTITVADAATTTITNTAIKRK